jgi:predicted NBD/HSP70 family sugar kinase
MTAGTPSLLRSMNEQAVLELMRDGGPISRAQIARNSGLSKPTVSVLLGGLLDARLVREVGRSAGGRGPSAVLYEINPNAGRVVGIDVGRRWVRAGIADITGEIIARRDERAKVRSAATLIGQIGKIAHELAADAGLAWRQVTHATLGTPGVFDPVHGLVRMAPNLPGWGRHGIVEAVREELGTNLTFENDVNLAALGEQVRGHGRGIENFVYLWVGTGIGMGIVLNGRLYRGSGGGAGEIGYLPIGADDPFDPRARRRGVFEEATSADGIVRSARELGMRPPLTAERVFVAARRGDPTARRVVDAEARWIALGLASIAPVLDPEVVILGGGIGRSGDLLLEPIERALQTVSPFRPRLVGSALGEDAVLHGAVATALDAGRRAVFAQRKARAKEVAG